MTPQETADLQSLIERPAFILFLLRVVANAGLFSAQTTGADDRDLNFAEGRRSLCLDILREVESAQPVPSLNGIPMVTSIQMFVAAAQSAPKEKPVGRRNDPYRDIGDGDDAGE